MAYVCFVSYKHGTMSDKRLPNLFTDISIHGDIFEGWTRPGNNEPSRHHFISLSRIEAIEFWDIVG